LFDNGTSAKPCIQLQGSWNIRIYSFSYLSLKYNKSPYRRSSAAQLFISIIEICHSAKPTELNRTYRDGRCAQKGEQLQEQKECRQGNSYRDRRCAQTGEQLRGQEVCTDRGTATGTGGVHRQGNSYRDRRCAQTREQLQGQEMCTDRGTATGTGDVHRQGNSYRDRRCAQTGEQLQGQ